VKGQRAPLNKSPNQSLEYKGLRPFRAPTWRLGSRPLPERIRPLVMGIVNLTPDSFYPDSRLPDPETAVTTALRMVENGADILDLGAESSRPGSVPVGGPEEQRRLLPVLVVLRQQTDIAITVDTTRVETARLCLEAGADGINDVTAGTAEPNILNLAAEHDCGLVLMHMRGTPQTMQDDPQYDDVVAEITTYLAQRAEAAEAVGVAAEKIIVDPGIGFGKTLAHNLALLAHLDELGGDRPLLLGASRKGFIGAVTGAAVEERLPGSLAALGAAFTAGVAVVRVHDVKASIQYLDILAAVASAHRSSA